MVDELDELLEEAGRPPRDHHYTFAHLALRQVAFHDALRVLAVLGSPDADDFVAELWSVVDKALARRGVYTDLGPNDILVHRRTVAGCPCAVLQMPEPIAVTEAHFVAIASLATFEEIQAGGGPIPIRYFTLERGVSLEQGDERTVLCEWTCDGAHGNYGDGPVAELDAFMEVLALRMEDGGGFAPRGTPVGHA